MGLDATVYAKGSEDPVLEVRLGNIAMVGYVRQHLLEAGIDQDGPLWFCIRSGSHSGDEIGFERVAALQSEIEAMIQVVRDADVGTFLQQLRELTEAASANEGPICFE